MIHILYILNVILDEEVIKELIQVIAIGDDRMGGISFFELNICYKPFLHNPPKKRRNPVEVQTMDKYTKIFTLNKISSYK